MWKKECVIFSTLSLRILSCTYSMQIETMEDTEPTCHYSKCIPAEYTTRKTGAHPRLPNATSKLQLYLPVISTVSFITSSDGYPLTVKTADIKMHNRRGKVTQIYSCFFFFKLGGRAIRIKDTVSETQSVVRSCFTYLLATRRLQAVTPNLRFC